MARNKRHVKHVDAEGVCVVARSIKVEPSHDMFNWLCQNHRTLDCVAGKKGEKLSPKDENS
jgi:hypothetical protein